MIAYDQARRLALCPLGADGAGMVVLGTQRIVQFIDRLKHGTDGESELWMVEIDRPHLLPVGVVLVPGGELQPSESRCGEGMVPIASVKLPAIDEHMPHSLHALIGLAARLAEDCASADENIFKKDGHGNRSELLL